MVEEEKKRQRMCVDVKVFPSPLSLPLLQRQQLHENSNGVFMSFRKWDLICIYEHIVFTYVENFTHSSSENIKKRRRKFL
jgi:hypothetical protein